MSFILMSGCFCFKTSITGILVFGSIVFGRRIDVVVWDVSILVASRNFPFRARELNILYISHCCRMEDDFGKYVASSMVSLINSSNLFSFHASIRSLMRRFISEDLMAEGDLRRISIGKSMGRSEFHFPVLAPFHSFVSISINLLPVGPNGGVYSG